MCHQNPRTGHILGWKANWKTCLEILPIVLFFLFLFTCLQFRHTRYTQIVWVNRSECGLESERGRRKAAKLKICKWDQESGNHHLQVFSQRCYSYTVPCIPHSSLRPWSVFKWGHMITANTMSCYRNRQTVVSPSSVSLCCVSFKLVSFTHLIPIWHKLSKSQWKLRIVNNQFGQSDTSCRKANENFVS